jgi:hypothetical protein
MFNIWLHNIFKTIENLIVDIEDNVPDVRAENNGMYIEQCIYDKIRRCNPGLTFYTNVYCRPIDGIAANRKGEFDILIGYIDNDVFVIEQVYDIKRSMALILADVDKFENILQTPFTLITDGQEINTMLSPNLIKGYIYVYPWDQCQYTKIITVDYLFQYINNNVVSHMDYVNFINLFTVINNSAHCNIKPIYDLVDTFITELNDANIQKLSGYEIYHCDIN